MRLLVSRFFTLCSALSLALFVVVCAFWVRSHATADTWGRRWVEGAVNSEIVVHSHVVYVGFLAHSYQAITPAGAKPWNHLARPAATTAAPFWFTPEGVMRYAHLAVYTGVLPVWWVARRYSSAIRRRRKLGLCPNCGYDLRASPERCPECGVVLGVKG